MNYCPLIPDPLRIWSIPSEPTNLHPRCSPPPVWNKSPLSRNVSFRVRLASLTFFCLFVATKTTSTPIPTLPRTDITPRAVRAFAPRKFSWKSPWEISRAPNLIAHRENNRLTSKQKHVTQKKLM
jgi:hypothetical protein